MPVRTQRAKGFQRTLIASAAIIPFSVFSVWLLMAAGNSYLVFSPTLQVRFLTARTNRAVAVIYVLICKYLSAISPECFDDFREIIIYGVKDQPFLS